MTEHTTRLRADARRNREQIITTAREVFLEQGIHAPLEEIARRAGIGIATLYRRFPDRHTLVQQVALANLALVGEELTRATTAHPDAWGALTQLIRRLVELRLSIIMPMLLPGLEEDARGEDETLRAQRDRLYDQMEHLTRAAQQAGQLRQGVNPIDIWLGVIKLSRPLPVIGSDLNDLITERQLHLFLGGLQATTLDTTDPLRRPLTLDEIDHHLRTTD
ncbi:TetR/AcrR family transcriptional regulator [Nonomuraea sp. NPDC050790]|uniref:TetR/AcrR family transcriptional regulator n=1 Tax=Nonomuraea sp. NPDC050790 TaxID=3364371 RepID=UPI0037BC352F